MRRPNWNVHSHWRIIFAASHYVEVLLMDCVIGRRPTADSNSADFNYLFVVVSCCRSAFLWFFFSQIIFTHMLLCRRPLLVYHSSSQFMFLIIWSTNLLSWKNRLLELIVHLKKSSIENWTLKSLLGKDWSPITNIAQIQRPRSQLEVHHETSTTLRFFLNICLTP